MKQILLAGMTIGLLAACDAPPAVEPASVAGQEQPGGETLAGPQATTATIDWEAARSAKLQQPVTDTPITVQNTRASQEPPKVPVLLPSGIVRSQSDAPPALVMTQDGYFATYKLPKYDAIVNGSQKAYAAGAAAAGGDKQALKFSTGEGSAQLSFSRFGADYLIEFECREVDGGESCITEDEAKAFADSLFVQQTQ